MPARGKRRGDAAAPQPHAKRRGGCGDGTDGDAAEALGGGRSLALEFRTPREARGWAKQRARFLNGKMAEYAARKQEGKVMQFLDCFLKGESEQKFGCRPTVHTWTTLINMYVKLGKVQEAEEVWRERLLPTAERGLSEHGAPAQGGAE
ncbi:unnamed protein product, partial [Prorocentrum cordatum]